MTTVINVRGKDRDENDEELIAYRLDRLERMEELAIQAAYFLFWFNADGSPCDGPCFRQERAKLEAMMNDLGYHTRTPQDPAVGGPTSAGNTSRSIRSG